MEIILREQRNIDFAIDALRRVDLSKPHVVTVKEDKRTRSMRQHGLYFMWVTAIANHVGQSKDDLHMQFKGKFLLPMLLRDGHEETLQTNEAIKVIWQAGLKDQATTAKRFLVNHISTTWLKVDQFTELLNEVAEYARDGGIALPYPEDYHEIMGSKK